MTPQLGTREGLLSSLEQDELRRKKLSTQYDGMIDISDTSDKKPV